ncbi:outer membrane transport energization protein TonB [Filimonas lacunae]|uniref:Outer membrane transport energization protein TonB n=1 Tax=Filimonas lacunae TaxID=477680 RepID=A0A173MMR8_9BACT|nr:energy transducer TonB [Filimonas lacunae]BAV08945.1 ferric siderophore transport system, periplasmic binding protein TonB [Filimonas lacunae]SIS64471.1 outer membrane transport energization protein TonB [Filimonas lacunae]
MQANNIPNADFLDILFDNKNKAYGAYNLRKTYDKRVYTALGITFAVGLIFSMTTLFAGGKKPDANALTGIVIDLTPVEQHKKEEPIEKPVEQPAAAPAAAPQLEQIRTLTSTPPIIIPDDQMRPEDNVHTVDELDKAQIASFTSDGEDPGGKAPALPEGKLGGTGGGGVDHLGQDMGEDLNTIRATVQIEAKYPGGAEAWRKFLEKNLNRDLPLENGAPTGKYTVTVSFVVDRFGNISEIKAESDPGFGAADEAVRVIKRSLKWEPAVQNGRNVVYRQRQRITFEVNED